MFHYVTPLNKFCGMLTNKLTGGRRILSTDFRKNTKLYFTKNRHLRYQNKPSGGVRVIWLITIYFM